VERFDGLVWSLDLQPKPINLPGMTDPSLWQGRDFRLFIGASAFAHLAYGINAVAFPWLATLLTRDPMLIGMVTMAPILPWLFFALPAGVLTDRLDHRQAIIWANVIRAALILGTFGLALTATPGTGAVWLLAALAFAQGTVEVLRDNTAQTILPQVVDKPQLEEANAVLMTSENLMSQFLGPPVAGAMIALSIALPFGVEAAALVGSAVLVALMATRVAVRPARQPFWPAMREGLAWLWGHLALRRLGLVLGAYNFLFQLIWSLMVLYAQDSLRLGSFGYGVLLSSLALGGLAGGVAAPWILRRLGVRRGLLMSVAGFCLSTGVLVFTDNPWIAGAALFGDAFTSMTWNVATVTYRQRHIPAPLLGRVNAAYRFLGSAPRPFAPLLGGALVALGAPLGSWALHLPFAIATVGGVFLLIYCARRLHLD
jgi:MFS family permease